VATGHLPGPLITGRCAGPAAGAAGALEAFTSGVERRIDTAEVNGRMFLNNVSLGIYGQAVRGPAYRDAEARTLLETAAEVMDVSASRATHPRDGALPARTGSVSS
jgi:diacylglycerol kinase family enzyme